MTLTRPTISADFQKVMMHVLAQLYLKYGISEVRISREAIEDELFSDVEILATDDIDSGATIFKWKMRHHKSGIPAPAGTIVDHRLVPLPPGKVEKVPQEWDIRFIRGIDFCLGMCAGAMLILLGFGLAKWLTL